MKVLVTGGAGFIGSHIVDALVAGGASVRVLDSLHPLAHACEPDYLNPAAEYLIGDLRDARLVEDGVRGVEAVCHQGAMVGLGVDFDDVEDYVANNGAGTAVLLRALYRRDFRGKLVLASSMVVYGEGRYRCPTHGALRASPRDPQLLAAGCFNPPCPTCAVPLVPEAVPEEAPLDPRNVYAATKVHQEHLCFAFGRSTGVPVTALRYHNVYGPRMPRDTPYAGVASIFRSALEGGRGPEVFEDGTQTRDFVHVRDVARANLLALSTETPFTGALNLASGEPRTVGEMAAALARAFGPGAPPPRVTGRFRLGDVRHVFASTALAERALGFRAEVGFEEGMAGFAVAPLRAAGRPSGS